MKLEKKRKNQERMEYFNIVLLLTIFVSSFRPPVVTGDTRAKTSDATNQKFTIEPENMSAVIGSRVVLPCRVINKQGVLQWTKDDFGLGTHRNLSAFDRYTMIGSESDGDYSLQIDSLDLEDDAKYQCQVSPGPEGQASIRSRFAQLTVLVTPEAPKIAQGDFILVQENQEIVLECESVGGKPAAKLTWWDEFENPITNGVKNSKETLPDGKRTTAKSVLRFKPQWQDHNTTITCQAKNTYDKSTQTASIKIEVQYAPKVEVTLESCQPPENSNFNASTELGDDDILEGSEVHFKCDVDANPKDVNYKWFINDELVVGDYTTEMAIYSVNRSQHEAVIRCEVTNDIDTTSDEVTMDVYYPPSFKETPKSVEGEKGDRVTLNCQADGNPLEIVWVHDPIDRLNYHPRVVSTKSTLKVTVSNDTAGRYYCKAIVSGFPEIKVAADVFLKQAPQITSPQQQFGTIGDTLHLECNAISIPRARHISWSLRGREIQTSGDHEFSILEEQTEQGIKSTLIIRNSQLWHFDKYNCSVVNDYGTDVMTIDLMQSETFIRHIRNNLPIFLTVSTVSGVILVVIICFIYIKTMGRKERQAKKEKHFVQHDNYMMNYSDDNSTDKCCKDSDRSSPSSVYKIKQSSSESNYSLPSTVSDNTLMQIINKNVNGFSYDKPITNRRSINYGGDEDAYYTSKDVHGSYGSITAIKNRNSLDYDDDRYYIANNIRNSQYAMNPNPNSNASAMYASKAAAVTNYAANTNRYVTHPKFTATSALNFGSVVDPRQEIGLPRSSIV